MKVTIKGDNLTPENFASVIESLNKEYEKHGIRVKNATCYIRFITADDETVDIVDKDKRDIHKVFTFKNIIKDE